MTPTKTVPVRLADIERKVRKIEKAVVPKPAPAWPHAVSSKAPF